MKLETSEEQVARGVAAIEREWPASVSEPYPNMPAVTLRPGEKPVELDDLVRTVLAAARPSAPPLPAEVEETASTLRWLSGDDSGKFTEGDKSVLLRAAALLSRWPGVWRPIETAPRDEPCILESAEGWVGEAWFSEDSDGWWMVNTHPTDAHDGQVLNPTGWMPLPAPGAAP